MSETEGGQTDEVGRRQHRGQADDIADKQTTSRTSRRHRRQGEDLVQGYEILQSKDFDCKIQQMTQFKRLWQQMPTNEQTIEEQLPYRVIKTAAYLHHVPNKHIRITDGHDFAVEGRVLPA
jgi:hypothetical protein